MYETETKPFKKVLKALIWFMVICTALCAMAFPPLQPVAGVTSTEPEIQLCTTTPSPTPTVVPTVAPAVQSAPPVVEPETEPEPEPEPEVDPNPYAELSLSEEEKVALACMAYSEAGNQEFIGQVAVIQVALNRYLHPAREFAGTLSDILYKPNQFAVGNYYEDIQMQAVEAALAGEPALELNTDVVFFSRGSLTYGSYYKTIGAHVFRTYT